MKTDEFDFLKESVALRAGALKLEFRSFVNDLERENVLERLASEAESLGYRIGREGVSLPAMLTNDGVLGGYAEHGYEQGVEIFVSAQYEAEHCSQKAWDALTFDEQGYYIDQFNDLCRRGIGEECRFYRLLMDRHLDHLVADMRAQCRTAEVLTNAQMPVDQSRAVVER